MEFKAFSSLINENHFFKTKTNMTAEESWIGAWNANKKGIPFCTFEHAYVIVLIIAIMTLEGG